MDSDMKLRELMIDNQHLTSQIGELVIKVNAQEHQESCTDIKNVLLQVYESIVRIEEHQSRLDTPIKPILEAYRSFFEPIHALSKLPSGDFLSARMFLYLANAFSSHNAPHKRISNDEEAQITPNALYEFVISLDDSVLEHLRRIWAAGDKCEEFSWVFGNYFVTNSRDEARIRELAQVLTPKELVALCGVADRRWRYGPLDGDEDEWRLCPDDLSDFDPRVMSPSKMIFFKQVDQDGPICSSFSFQVFDERQGDWGNPHSFSIFRRSQQFIFDARSIAQQTLAQQAVTQTRLPLEMQMQIMDYLEPPKMHAYLAKVDIATAYLPFPEATGLCDGCELDKNKWGEEVCRLRNTCPEGSIHLWSLALRTFHIFHENHSEGWGLCRFGTGCQGHHEDNSWEVESEEQLVSLIEALIGDRCGTTTTLDQIGLGRAPNCRLVSREEDKKRQRRMFSGIPPQKDITRELQMNGGIGGLIDSMMHNRLLVGAFIDGIAITKQKWSWARNVAERERGALALTSLHDRCDLC